MNTRHLKHNNLLAILRCVNDGINTLDDIAKEINMTKIGVSDLTSELVQREIFSVKRVKETTKAGRPTNVYSMTNKYFCVYIEKKRRHLSTIAISAFGRAIDRFDLPLVYHNYTLADLLSLTYLKITEHLPLKYCLGIYLVGNDIPSADIPEGVILKTKTELILESLADPTKISLIVINNKPYLNIYSHIHYPSTGIISINRAIKVDETITIDQHDYFQLFEVFKRLSGIKLEESL